MSMELSQLSDDPKIQSFHIGFGACGPILTGSNFGMTLAYLPFIFSERIIRKRSVKSELCQQGEQSLDQNTKNHKS